MTSRPDSRAPRSDARDRYNEGLALQARGLFTEAEEAYRAALTLRPDYPLALNNLATLLCRQGALREAEKLLGRAARLEPGNYMPLANLGITLRDQGRPSEALVELRAALSLAPGNEAVRSDLLYTLNCVSGLSAADVGTLHRQLGATVPAAGTSPGLRPPETGPESLRIGYVSPDFRHHSVARFVEPILEHHDRDRFEIHCYSDVAHEDGTTARLRSLTGSWHRIAGLDHTAVARMISSHDIHILVDLAGHTAGNRLPVFAGRAAPVQVTWLGYPNTTGVPSVDFRVTDSVTDPDGAEELYVERLQRLPTVFLCYSPERSSPDTAPLPPCRSLGHTTFGSFNHLSKLSEATVALWAAVLDAVPGSRLLLKGRGFRDEAVCAAIRARFARVGIGANRIHTRPDTRDAAEHLAAYHEVDIALDPTPYNGATTTCEALWMGVPVVTLAGDRHAARVGASILGTVGLAEIVAATDHGFVDIARRLAGDTVRLTALRRDLRKTLSASKLCDGASFTRDLEAAYEKMWTIRMEETQR